MCGAGIAGLTVARQLALGGWQVTVAESAPERRDQGYMIDFFGPGFDAADSIGLLPRLRELAYPIDVVNFIDSAGRTRHLDYTLVAKSQGGRLLSLMRQDVELALLESLPAGVDVQFGKTVATVSQTADAVTAGFSDGSSLGADLLIGADGIHSTVRAQVFGPEDRWVRQLGYHTCAYTFDDDALHRKLDGTWGFTDTIDRMGGLYAMRDGRVAFFGAHRVDDVRLPGNRRAAVLEAYSGLGWHIDEALAHCPDDSDLYYDQVAQVELSPWSQGRVVLVGDSCQAVSLLAGQGASLAVAGGYLLARELLAATSTGSITEALGRYERKWMPVAAKKQAAGRRSAASFLPRSSFGLVLRRAGLRLMQLPGVGRLVSSRVVGKQGAALQ